MSLGTREFPDTLKGFSFGFNYGEEEYRPESYTNWESVRWSHENTTMLLFRNDNTYSVLFSDTVEDRQYDGADVTKSKRRLPFDPMLFKVIGLQFIEGIPAEVT